MSNRTSNYPAAWGRRHRGRQVHTFRLEDRLWERLEFAASSRGQSVSAFLRDLISAQLGEPLEVRDNGLGAAPLRDVFDQIERDLADSPNGRGLV